MRTLIHLHTAKSCSHAAFLPSIPELILSVFSTETSCSTPVALGPLETIKRYMLMKYRECSGFNFTVPIIANCNMANYFWLCRIASAIVSCSHQTKKSTKWHLRGVNWAFHYFNYVVLWFTFTGEKNKAIWKSSVRCLVFSWATNLFCTAFPMWRFISKRRKTR